MATEGARILRDQLYLVKINNARTNTVFQTNRNIREKTITALNDSNNIKVAKLS